MNARDRQTSAKQARSESRDWRLRTLVLQSATLIGLSAGVRPVRRWLEVTLRTGLGW